MKKKVIYILTTVIFFTICILLFVYNNEIQFDKAGWMVKGDLNSYPNRKRMLNDLIQNQKIKGLTFRQIIDKLGAPEKNIFTGSNSIYYEIMTDYGSDIDPVYNKSLEFKFDKDSIITDFKINKWKH